MKKKNTVKKQPQANKHMTYNPSEDISRKIYVDPQTYPNLAKYSDPIDIPKRHTLHREHEIELIQANLDRPEYSNVILLGDAGSGKTAIVSELARRDQGPYDFHYYREINLSKMASSSGSNGNGAIEMAARLTAMVKEVERFQYTHNRRMHDLGYYSAAKRYYQKMYKKTKNPKYLQDPTFEMILFIDEFHRIAQTTSGAESPAAQAIKPLLAESGEHNIRIIAATTYDEFDDYIRGDEALTERLQRISITPPPNDVIIKILQAMARLYLPKKVHIQRHLFNRIINVTNRYMRDQAQPRKSIVVLDSMIGWWRYNRSPLNDKTLARVIYDNKHIKINYNIDVPKMARYLNSKVISQRPAVQAITQRMYMSVTHLVDPTRPQGSFLFTGSTGVGKTQMAKCMTQFMFHDQNRMIRADMSEYSSPHSVNRFRDWLTRSIWEQPYSVVLLDEIEKSCPEITKLLLQVLDDAELSNQHGRDVNFSDCYIILTTNAAANVFSTIEHNGDATANDLTDYRALIKRRLITDPDFPTELINRLNTFVPFIPLQKQTFYQIALMHLNDLNNLCLSRHGTRLHYGEDVIHYLIDENFSTDTNSGGARGLNRKIDQEITAKVAQFIYQYPDIHDIAINENGELASRNKHMLRDKSYISVQPYKPSANSYY